MRHFAEDALHITRLLLVTYSERSRNLLGGTEMNGKILIVEDEKKIARFLQLELEHACSILPVAASSIISARGTLI